MTSSNLSADDLLGLYERMLLIRRMEEELGTTLKTGEIPGPAHLYIGQEAVAVGICALLDDRDTIASTHRGHGHFLAKGGDPGAMMAEVFGKATGICGGKGGSMHVADFSKGILGANGIVGGGIALSVGSALAAQLDRQGRVSACFFGDGGANQGVLMEALNVGALWRLPLVLVCENNGFSEFSPSATVTAGRIVDRATPFGVPGIEVDGNDVIAVWQAADVAVRRAREGGGPTLIEARTYRTRGHVETEHTFLSMPYRSVAEVDSWIGKDPIARLSRHLAEVGLVQPDEIAAVAEQVEARVRDAFAFAASSPQPDVSTAFQHMFA